ncbi:MAG: hypothetical protein GEU91_00795 [Rhizobiales bacterium]|nr:hypothetical protein [Hyphomicrobiales bacterium]
MNASRPLSAAMRCRVSLPPETVAEIRRQYAGGDMVEAICRQFTLSRTTLYRCLDRARDAEGKPLPKIPRRRSGVRRQRVLTGDRTTLVARLWRTAEGQVREIEDRLARREQEPGERERDARVMALLSRTLRELIAADKVAPSAPRPSQNAATDDDDPVPRDLDELRRVVSRRLDGLIADAKATYPDEGEEP